MGLTLLESFKGANIFAKLAFIFLFLAMIIGWTSYCTPSWGRSYYDQANVVDFMGYGVWVRSTNGITPQIEDLDGWLLEWYGAFQAFATFGFICLNVGFLLVILFMFVNRCKSNADLAFWNGINNIFGSVCWLVAIILFGSFFDEKFDRVASSNYKKEHELHYSFGFGVVTFIFQLVAGIVLLLTNRGGGSVGAKK